MNSCLNSKNDLSRICISILGEDNPSRDIYRIVTTFCNNVHFGGLCPNADLVFARPSDLENTVIPVMPLIVYGSYQEFREITIRSLQSLTKQRFELLLIPTDAMEVIQRIRLALCYDHPASLALKELNHPSVSIPSINVADSGVELHHAIRE